jgi:murein lipoprotein
MLKTIKLSAVMAIAVLAAGCASNSDLEALTSRVGSLENKVATASSDSASAKATAADAAAKAAAAEAAANRAAQYAQDSNKKLDNLFKKTQHK